MSDKYNRAILQIASEQIERQICMMAHSFTSHDFYTEFASRHTSAYERIVGIYVDRGYDLAHATQIAHREFMHTVKNRFGHLVQKVGDCGNPKGGTMSLWCRG